MRLFAALMSAAVVTSAPSASSRADDQPAPEQKSQAAQPNDATKDKKKTDELAEAARLIPGPAGQPECVWLGRRVVILLYRDDLDTAFRHLDIYDRFGCPAGHIQEAFRCVLRQGDIDVKSAEFPSRVHACWLNPGLSPATASSAPPGSTGQGTSNQ